MKRKFIKYLSNVITFTALVFAAAPCYGRFYEPKLPIELSEDYFYNLGCKKD